MYWKGVLISCFISIYNSCKNKPKNVKCFWKITTDLQVVDFLILCELTIIFCNSSWSRNKKRLCWDATRMIPILGGFLLQINLKYATQKKKKQQQQETPEWSSMNTGENLKDQQGSRLLRSKYNLYFLIQPSLASNLNACNWQPSRTSFIYICLFIYIQRQVLVLIGITW